MADLKAIKATIARLTRLSKAVKQRSHTTLKKKAAVMREAGASYAAIGKALSVSHTKARDLIIFKD